MPADPPPHAPLWTPTPQARAQARITDFARFVGQPADDYPALWAWSTQELEDFWLAVWRYFDVGPEPPVVLAERTMPGAEWFPGTWLNYAERLFRDRDPAAVAVRFASELGADGAWTWAELTERTARIRAGLQRHGVGPGDRVAAYLPNTPETLAAFLACASLGAIWSSAAPEFGAQAVIDRFSQIEPAVLLAVDGYRYGGKDFDRRGEVDQIHAAVGGELVPFGYLHGGGWPAEFVATFEPLAFTPVPFDHPLWVLYSSGTTGKPKPIVHGHGGILLEQLKHQHLHLGATADDTVLWFTTTGWMMWNFLAGVLLTGATIVLYDGNPAGPVLWDLAERTETTIFGTSAAFLTTAMRAGEHPSQGRDLQIRAVGSTGSPLSPQAFEWVSRELGADTWVFSTSGGTDVCTAFVGGVPTLPVYAGELQAPSLGAALESWDPQGQPLVGEVGELVLTAPMPSMPLFFWGDEDGSRLREAYFDTYPGVWRHGDWIELTPRGSAVIHGRSDATINRGGVRMGTAEIYSAVLGMPEIADALVVDVPLEADASTLWLFVQLAVGAVMDDALRRRIAGQVRTVCSPRHVPDRCDAVAKIPRTLSGKVVEVPVKRILLGADPDDVVSRDSLVDPAAVDAFVALRPAR